MAQHMDMNKMMKQAQQMQKELAKAQAGLADEETTVTAGGGMVKVTITGDLTVKEVVIDPDAVDPEDVEMLQETVCAAVNEAIRSAKALADERLGGVTGGLNIPGLM